MADQVKGLSTTDTPAKDEPKDETAAKPAEEEAKPAKDEKKARDEATKRAREEFLRAWPLEAEETR